MKLNVVQNVTCSSRLLFAISIFLDVIFAGRILALPFPTTVETPCLDPPNITDMLNDAMKKYNQDPVNFTQNYRDDHAGYTSVALVEPTLASDYAQCDGTLPHADGPAGLRSTCPHFKYNDFNNDRYPKVVSGYHLCNNSTVCFGFETESMAYSCQSIYQPTVVLAISLPICGSDGYKVYEPRLILRVRAFMCTRIGTYLDKYTELV